MLNRTLCWKCFFQFHHSTHEDGWHYITLTEDKTFEKYFKDGKCAIYPFNIPLKARGNPPEDCPFLLEQTLVSDDIREERI
jgi:hypothetical protein